MSDESKKFNFNISADVARGEYVNGSIICHSATEFVLDFLRQSPGMAQPTVAARVVMAPETARQLLAALAENYGKWLHTHAPNVVERINEDIRTHCDDTPDDHNIPPLGFSGKGNA